MVPAQSSRDGWNVAAETPQQISDAMKVVEASLTPATGDQIAFWMMELSVITARREEAPEAEDLRLYSYSKYLSEYPADVAHEAMLTHRWKFFPSWAELGEVCDRLAAKRRALRAALERAAAEAAERELRARALPTEKTLTKTPQEREASKARTNAIFSDVMAELNANLRAERAEKEAMARRAVENYERFRPKTAEEELDEI